MKSIKNLSLFLSMKVFWDTCLTSIFYHVFQAQEKQAKMKKQAGHSAGDQKKAAAAALKVICIKII